MASFFYHQEKHYMPNHKLPTDDSLEEPLGRKEPGDSSHFTRIKEPPDKVIERHLAIGKEKNTKQKKRTQT